MKGFSIMMGFAHVRIEERSRMKQEMEILVDKALEGDRGSLEELIEKVQDPVYGLAIRMLSHPADAEDATQEILVKIVTNLGSFQNESKFTTWVYRIASNHLLTTRKRRAELWGLTFGSCEEWVDRGLEYGRSQAPYGAEQDIVAKETMIACLQAMLLCLDRKLRLTFILDHVFGINSVDGAYILDITPAAFRKRLSRARELVRDFMKKKCGLFNSENPCRCARQVAFGEKRGVINPGKLLFATHPSRTAKDLPDLRQVAEMDEFKRLATLFRSHPDYIAPKGLVEALKNALQA
jgi:RNA polymerase sigma factor (sigma-70 family)